MTSTPPPGSDPDDQTEPTVPIATGGGEPDFGRAEQPPPYGSPPPGYEQPSDPDDQTEPTVPFATGGGEPDHGRAEQPPPPGYGQSGPPPPGYGQRPPPPPGYAQQPPPPPGYVPPGYVQGAGPGAPWGVHPVTGVPYSDKQKLVAGLLQILVPVGVGRMYMGNVGLGIAQLVVTLVTCGIGALWPFIDGILILAGDPKDEHGRPLRS